MGSAAVLGDQRITVSSLDTQVANFNTAAAPYGSQVQLTSTEVPAAVLSWLIRFQIEDQVAASAWISVTQAQVQQGIASVNSQAQQAAAQNGLNSAQSVFLNAGISPQMVPSASTRLRSSPSPSRRTAASCSTTTAENNTVTAALTKAQCTAAKSLNIQVNPQFGRLDYTQYTVVPAPDTLSRPAGRRRPRRPRASPPRADGPAEQPAGRTTAT